MLELIGVHREYWITQNQTITIEGAVDLGSVSYLEECFPGEEIKFSENTLKVVCANNAIPKLTLEKAEINRDADTITSVRLEVKVDLLSKPIVDVPPVQTFECEIDDTYFDPRCNPSRVTRTVYKINREDGRVLSESTIYPGIDISKAISEQLQDIKRTHQSL